MGKIIAVANQKGGVGKTTTTVNLASALGYSGKRVLVVDVDPQGNATSGLGINKRDLLSSTYNLMISGARFEDTVLRTSFRNIDLLPSNIHLAGVEIELVAMENRTYRLKQAFAAIRDRYDYIFIDCPPSLGLITLNAFTAADSILIPIQCEYYALEGLSQLISTVKQVRRMYNSHLELEGVLLTMYDTRLNLTVQVAAEVKKYFADKVFKTVIPRNVRISEAPSYGQPVQYYEGSSKGSEAYNQLCKEFLTRQ